MSLLLPDTGLIFWTLLVFGIVFIILAKYGFPVIVKMVEGRKTYIDQSLEVARQANAQLLQLKAEGNAIIAAANKEQGRIMKEAMPLICQYGFEEMNLHRIEGFVDARNTNCKKAMAKINFRNEGCMHDCEQKGGEFISLDIFACLKNE